MNILLDVAELVGPPFTWAKFSETLIRNRATPVPNYVDRRIDSLKAVAVATTGNFAGPEMLEVWSSAHIDRLLLRKAAQPQNGANAEARGLGWSRADADSLLHDFLYDLIFDMTGGGRVELDGVHGHPPLDHEDACVFTTALQAAHETVPPTIKYCVTRDKEFRRATGLSANVLVMHPEEFVCLVRRARATLATKRMLPPGH